MSTKTHRTLTQWLKEPHNQIRIKSLVIAGLLLALGGYLFELYIRGQLLQYVHPVIQPLVLTAAVAMIIASVIWIIIRPDHIHATWTQIAAVGALIGVLIIVPARPLSVGILQQRSVGDTVPIISRSTTIRGSTENFTVLDWVVTWESDLGQRRYAGAPARVIGFINRRDGEVFLTRFLITCCVVDAQPVQMRVSPVDPNDSVQNIPADGVWVEARGTVQDRDGKPVLQAVTIRQIDEPNPAYVY
jgi:uncharacterized repeat protein (TIGR03943 family)